MQVGGFGGVPLASALTSLPRTARHLHFEFGNPRLDKDIVSHAEVAPAALNVNVLALCTNVAFGTQRVGWVLYPGGIRTRDHPLNRRMLYPLS
jgi:hypothetical protein